ncbi:MAG: hypothetical protein SFY96_00405 [Planctomycetota bacterium]|nr:hypothetical protein [Planctomycetota bacterium]
MSTPEETRVKDADAQRRESLPASSLPAPTFAEVTAWAVPWLRALLLPLLGVVVGAVLFCTQSSAPTAGVVASLVYDVACALPFAVLVSVLAIGPRLKGVLHWDGQRWVAKPVPWALALAYGFAFLLILLQLFGLIGIAKAGPLVLIVVTGMNAIRVWRGRAALFGTLREFPAPRLSAWWLVPSVCLGVMVAAACSPPGWLWDSEFGGYDALSYHLQLPKEWLAAGRLSSLKHNVYSYLPGFIEGAYLFVMGAMTTSDSDPTAGNGLPLLACQLFTLLTAVLAAWVTAELGVTLARRAGVDESRVVVARWVVFALMITTPWMVVTGTLAYNEPAMLALGAGAMLAAASPGYGPLQRGVVVAMLLGGAIGVKPTAGPMFGVPTLVMLLAFTPRREWWRWLVSGVAVGVVTLLPWTIRNSMAGGNPLFPLGHTLLGSAHWTAEQFTRFASAHTFDGTLWERVRMLFVADASDPAGVRHRGIMHPQYGVFVVVLVAAIGALAAHARGRAGVGRVFVVLVLGIVGQLVVWLFLTHLQSRFLMPLLVPGLACVGVACAAAGGAMFWRVCALANLVIVLALTAAQRTPGMSAGATWDTLVPRERAADLPRPADGLALGCGAFSGETFRELVGDTPDALRQRPELVDELGPQAYTRVVLAKGSRVLLLGDAAPLYYPRGTGYATTWDTHPLTRAALAGGEASAWVGVLRDEGYTHLLINASEIARLGKGSGAKGSTWWDPRLPPAAVEQVARVLGAPVKQWPGGVALFELGAKAK